MQHKAQPKFETPPPSSRHGGGDVAQREGLERRLALRAARAGSLEFRPDLSFVANAPAAALLGLYVADAVMPGSRLAEHLSLDDWAALAAAVEDCCGQGAEFSLELNIEGPGAGRRLLALLGAPLGDGHCLCVVSDRRQLGDLEARLERAQAQLARGEQRFDLAVAAGRDAVWDWDLASGEVYVSPRLAELLGMPFTALDPERLLDFVHRDDLDLLIAARRAHLRGNLAFRVDVRLQQGSGDYRWFHVTGRSRRDPDGRVTYMAGSITDVHEQVMVQRYLEETRRETEALNRRLAELSARVVQAQEEERRHIARELHDDVGQILTATVLNIEFWRGREIADDERAEVLGDIKRALARVRDLSLNLRPPLLDESGLEGALDWHLQRQAAAGRLRVELDCKGLEPERPPPVVEITAFRIVQEAMTNALRHARATEVRVSLCRDGEGLGIDVVDDGVGFEVRASLARVSGGASLGLLGMSERAKLIGGHWEIESTPGAGSRVHAWLPWSTA